MEASKGTAAVDRKLTHHRTEALRRYARAEALDAEWKTCQCIPRMMRPDPLPIPPSNDMEGGLVTMGGALPLPLYMADSPFQSVHYFTFDPSHVEPSISSQDTFEP